MTSRANLFCSYALALTCAASLACDTTSEKPKERPAAAAASRPVKALDEAFTNGITPLVHGGAYLSALSGGTWYLKDGVAERVHVVGSPADSALFAAAFDLDITPTVEGDAYGYSLPGRGIWLLRGARARRVTEGVIAEAADDTSSGSPLYTMYLHELQKRRRLARDREDAQEAKASKPDQDDPPDNP